MTAIPPGWTPEQARKRLEAATPGPWLAATAQDGGWIVTTEDDDPATWQAIADTDYDRPADNAIFIAHAPTDIAALLALLDDARAALRANVGDSFNLLTQGESPTQLRGPSAQRIYDRSRAFLARFAADKDKT